ncbi:hypothetical protein [Streptomyces sp. E-08]|uniref:hypothetical protein n=1 Tax=Streptomyces sp. E-08 TaxID=3404047 RepID=UPI003CF950DD
MTVFQAVHATPAALMDLDPYRFPAVCVDDPYAEPRTAGPVDRPAVHLAPADRRRLELHAALTTAGIAPVPGDLDAVEALCALDDATHTALRRWLGAPGVIAG